MISRNHVHIDQALKTPQFYLIWLVLFLNVTAGIGILGQASVMIQESFKDIVTAAAAAGFVGLLSLFNMGGRFVWASASDWIGRKNTYFIFFALGAVLYLRSCRSFAATRQDRALRALVLRDPVDVRRRFRDRARLSRRYVRHGFRRRHSRPSADRVGRGGVAGPVLVNYIRAYEVAHGVAKADAYTMTLHIMAVLLVVGFICNLLVKRVNDKHHMTDAQLAKGA